MLIVSTLVAGLCMALCSYSCYQSYLSGQAFWMYLLAAFSIWNGLIFFQGLAALI